MPVDKFGRMSDLKTKDTGVSLTYINNNYVRSDGETPLTGSLDMRGNTLYNVADPVNPQDVVTKVYVDNTKGSGVIGRKTGNGVSIKENLDFLGKQRIKNLPDPVNEKDAVTKEYVDTTTAPFLKLDQTKYNTKGDIDMGDQFTVLNVKTPIDDNHIVDKKYVDEMDNLKSAFAFRNGEYYAKGGVIMRKNKLGGLREPTQDGEAANKKYVDDTTKNLFIDENDNIAFGLNVDMEGNQILGLPEPATDQEPATKKYVDDLQTQNIDEKGNIKFGRNINLDRNRIFSMKEPTKPSEGANKKYVDDTITKRLQEEKDNFLPQDPATKEYVDEAIKQVAGGDILVSKEGVFIKANGHYRATAPLDIDNHKMENLPDPVDDKDAVNKKYIDGIVENLTLKQGLIRENGGFNLVDSYINMNFNNIRNLGLPKDESDAVPRRFVDGEIRAVEEKIQKIKEKSEERPFLKENGNYQASTSINMNFNKLLNLQKPAEPYDAATKDYVDYVEKEIKEKLDKKTQIIAVYANYTGPLFYNKFQFSFGGNEAKNSVTGFLIPQSGRIKKIKMRTPINKESFNKRVIEKNKLNSDFRNGFFEFTIKKVVDGLYQTIGKIHCKEAYNLYEYDEEGNKKWFPFYDFCFDDPLPLGEKEDAEVEEGDILNIRTIINSEFDFPPYSDKLDSDAFSLYKKDPHIGNTYLVTFLIELDPL